MNFHFCERLSDIGGSWPLPSPISSVTTKELKVCLHRAISALSDALDLVGVDDVFHGKRVAFMAVQFGYRLGLEPERLTILFDLGLLHDCGVSSSLVHQQLINNFDWRESQEHCEIGYERLKKFTPLAHLSEPIRYHHTRWEELRTLALEPDLAQSANLIFLADRIDALAIPHYGDTILPQIDRIRTQIAAWSGDFFDPRLVEAFLSAADSQAFWLAMEPRHLAHFIQESGEDREPASLTFAELKDLARIFAAIIDAKSSYTAEHSLGVARLAGYLAARYGYPEEICDKIEAAALLHDLGKLRVPDEILDKASPLTPEDLTRIQQHSFDTYEVLRQIPGIEDIAFWAAFHHENLTGTGYPFHARADQICMEARIISVADIFQALAQNRPYRNALPLAEVLTRLEHFAGRGLIDDLLVSLVKRNPEDCYRKALVA